MTCGPLEGVLVCLCKSFPGEESFHGGFVPFWPSWGVEDPKDGHHTPRDGEMTSKILCTWGDENFLWRHLENTRGRNQIPLYLDDGLWRPKMSPFKHWCHVEARVFGGIDGTMHVVMCFEGRRGMKWISMTWDIDTSTLEAQRLASRGSMSPF